MTPTGFGSAAAVSRMSLCSMRTVSMRRVASIEKTAHVCALDGRAIRKSIRGGVRNVVLYHRKLHAEGAGGHGQKSKNQPPRSGRKTGGRRWRQAGRHVRHYRRGPGAMVIFEADPAVALAIAGVAASSDGVSNVKMQRLFSGDEVRAIRQKRVELQKSYRPPGK